MGKQHDKRVIIFTLKGCLACEILCRWLRSINFEFEEKEIKENKKMWDRAKIEGALNGEEFDTIPTIMIIDKEDNRYYFNQPRDFKTPRDGLDSIQDTLLS